MTHNSHVTCFALRYNMTLSFVYSISSGSIKTLKSKGEKKNTSRKIVHALHWISIKRIQMRTKNSNVVVSARNPCFEDVAEVGHGMIYFRLCNYLYSSLTLKGPSIGSRRWNYANKSTKVEDHFLFLQNGCHDELNIDYKNNYTAKCKK